MKNSDTVTVCSSCLTAACWQGEFYCENYKTAGTVEMEVGKLKKLKLEDPHYWRRDLEQRRRLAEFVSKHEGNKMELPKYRCHKEVYALKIRSVVDRTDTIPGRILTFSDPGYESLELPVSAEYIRKHAPVPGGYYVVYKDGYTSFSPADVFEEGYTRA